jgi:hypothetical protein
MRRVATAALTTALAASLLVGAPAGSPVLAPPPAAASDPIPRAFSSDTIEAVDLGTHPSFLVLAGDQAHYFAQTELATAAQEYGTTGAPGAEQLQAFADAERYDDYLAGAPEGAGTFGAIDLALGNLVGSADLEAVALVAGAEPSAPKRLVVTGAQSEGFPFLAATDAPATATHVAILEGEGAGAVPLILVATGARHDGSAAGNAFVGYRAGGSTLTRVPITEARDPVQPDFGTILDLAHRPDWDRHLAEVEPGGDATFAFVTPASDGRATATVADVTFTGGATASLSLRAQQPVGLTRAFGRTVTGARIAYDYELAQPPSSDPIPPAPGWEPRVAVGVVYDRAGVGTTPGREVIGVEFARDEFDTWVGTDLTRTICADATSTAGPPAVDVELLSRGSDATLGGIACSAPVPGSAGSTDRLRVGRTPWDAGVGQGTSLTELASLGGDWDEVRDPAPQLLLPCLWLLETHEGARGTVSERKSCTSGSAQYSTTTGAPTSYTLGGSAGDPARMAVGVMAGARAGEGGFQPVWISAAGDDPSGAAGPARFTVTAIDEGTRPRQGFVTAMLPHQRNRVTLQVFQDPTRLPDPSLAPRLVQADPYPIAFLAAPPQVAGAGQDVDPPTFASSTTSGSSTSTSTSSRIGAYLGIDYEDPLGAFAVEVQASFESEAEQGTEISREVTTSTAFDGIADQDVVVYRTVRLRQYSGLVLASSTGVAQGTITEVSIPAGATTSASSVDALVRRFPAVFGPGPNSLKPALDRVFSHTVGDPGTYLPFGTTEAGISGYCDGSLEPGGDRELRTFDPRVPATPFTSGKPADPPTPDILLGDVHQVIVGSPNAEGGAFEITNAITNSRVVSNSIDLEAGFTAGYVQGGITGGATWSTGWSQSLGSGVSFESGVGHIPGWTPALEAEQYDWRSFLCQKTIDLGNERGTLTAWVLNYAVDGYTGSGGLAPLGPITLDTPVASQVVDTLRPALRFSQPSGTVARYDVRLEAVGTNDVHTKQITYDTIAASRADRPESAEVTPERDLLPDQLYRWRVTSTDFFDNTTTTEFEFFRTPGPVVVPDPSAAFDAEDRAPRAGQPVRLSNASTSATTFAWDFGDGTTSTEPDPTHTWTRAGTYTVTLTASTPGKPDSTATRQVRVAAAVQDDQFRATEDTELAVDAPGVFGNDLGATSLEIVAGPGHGTLTGVRDDGSFRYTPDRDFCGADSFVYSADGNPIRPSAVVRITVACVDDGIGTRPDRYVVTEDQSLEVPAPGVLGNDVDPDGGAAQAEVVTGAAHGTLRLDADGGLRYVPDADFCGPDGFTYRAAPGGPAEAASIEVRCANDPATARDDAATLAEDGSVRIRVLDNDTDPDGGTLEPTLVDGPGSGTATFEGGSLVYAPGADFCGTDLLTYRVKDAPGSFDEAQVRVRVTCVNDVARTQADRYSREGRRTLIVPRREGVLANDTDVDSSALRVQVVSRPAVGRLRLAEEGGFRLRLPAGANPRRVTFTYRVWDGVAWSAPERVVITRR